MKDYDIGSVKVIEMSEEKKMQAMCSKQGRFFYFDLLRVIACLSVIMIHSSAEFVKQNIGTPDFWVGNVFDSFARVGVPLFVMISGALFLDEQYAYTPKKMISHIIKIVLFFLFWSLCYTLLYNLLIPMVKHEDISIKSLLGSFIRGHFHLWFCYMIVGLYLIVPLLRLWVKKENIAQVRYFIFLTLIVSMFIPRTLDFGCLLFPNLSPLKNVIDDMNITYVGGYTSYFILGWYLNNFEIKHKKTMIILGILGIFVSIIGTAILSMSLNEPHQTYDNISVHVFFQTAMVFSLVKEKYKKEMPRSVKIPKAVLFVSKHSLGIYAIHVFLIDVVSHFLRVIGVSSSILCIPLIFVSLFVVSLLGAAIMGKIPFLRKVV